MRAVCGSSSEEPAPAQAHPHVVCGRHAGEPLVHQSHEPARAVDLLGDLAGDEALQQLAQSIRLLAVQQTRELAVLLGDGTCRFGQGRPDRGTGDLDDKW